MIEFVVLGKPKGKGRPRASVIRRGSRVFAHMRTPNETRELEQTFAARAIKHSPLSPLAGPIRLTIGFVFPIPASWSKAKRAAAIDAPCASKPDIDNLSKLVLDALNGVFWLDDKQVTDLRAVKLYGEIPQTSIRIEEVVA